MSEDRTFFTGEETNIHRERSLEEWIRLVKAQGPAVPENRVIWLKVEYGLDVPHARAVAEAVAESER
jgi:hypothetical protein